MHTPSSLKITLSAAFIIGILGMMSDLPRYGSAASSVPRDTYTAEYKIDPTLPRGDKSDSDMVLLVYKNGVLLDSFRSHTTEELATVPPPTFEDFSGDRAVDIAEIGSIGATGNTSFEYHIFNTTSGKFEYKPKLSGFTAYKNGQAVRKTNDGCAGECYTISEYLVPNPDIEPMLVREVISTRNPDDETGNSFVVTVRIFIEGEMREVSREVVAH